MERIKGLRRIGVLGLAAAFSIAAVAGYFHRGGWADDVQAVELQASRDPAPQAPQAPVDRPQGPEPEDDEPVARRLDDDDAGPGPADDVDDDVDDGNNTGDGDRTRGNDGTSGGNNTRHTRTGTGGGTTD